MGRVEMSSNVLKDTGWADRLLSCLSFAAWLWQRPLAWLGKDEEPVPAFASGGSNREAGLQPLVTSQTTSEVTQLRADLEKRQLNP